VKSATFYTSRCGGSCGIFSRRQLLKCDRIEKRKTEKLVRIAKAKGWNQIAAELAKAANA
jgi:hypothetical protein